MLTVLLVGFIIVLAGVPLAAGILFFRAITWRRFGR
jgi:hypothetical protein